MNQKILDDLREQSLAHALSRVSNPYFAYPEKAKGFLPILITGGIGDLITFIPAIDQIIERVGPVKIFCSYPDVFRYFRPGIDRFLSNKAFPGFDFYLRTDTVPRFIFGRQFKSLPKAIQAIYTASKIFHAGKIGRWIDYQPFCDYELWRDAAELGWKRHTIAMGALGLERRYFDQEKFFQMDLSPIDLEPFITVHDGFDVTQKSVPYRATKTWNLRHWQELTNWIKRRYPKILIVQLGGPTSRPIPGVDINFSGKLRIEQSLNVLGRSRLHIDGDSGLVHAGRAMGIKSIVLFGPTPKEFFGYAENINIGPMECGGCGWVVDTWMNKCPLFDRPKCMDSIFPADVFFGIDIVLSSQSESRQLGSPSDPH
jgi:hypothetical protein